MSYNIINSTIMIQQSYDLMILKSIDLLVMSLSVRSYQEQHIAQYKWIYIMIIRSYYDIYDLIVAS